MLPSSPIVLAWEQTGDKGQKWLALHQNNMERNYQTTQKLCIYTKDLSDNFLQASPACFSVCQILCKKWKKKTAFIIGDDDESFKTDHHWKLCPALPVYNLIMVIHKAIQSFQFRDLKIYFWVWGLPTLNIKSILDARCYRILSKPY